MSLSLALLALAFQGAGAAPTAPISPYPEDEADLVTPAEHRARRQALLAKIPAGSAAVFFTNPLQQRSNDTDFPFRANSDFWYLTGCTEPESALILCPDGMTIDGKLVKEALFVQPRNPAEETWTGRRMGAERAAPRLGIETSLPNTRFGDGMRAIAEKTRVRVAGIEGATGLLAKMVEAAKPASPFTNNQSSLTRELGIMRTAKSPKELELMRRAIDVSVLAHTEALKSAGAGMREWEIRALVEYIFARNGCESVAYGSIVGSGENSCTLHYESDRKLMQAGEMVVMDVGAEYHGYAADVTRSYPVDGKFTPDQRAIYELVLRAQNAGIAACRAGAPFNAADEVAHDIIGAGLVKLGLITKPAEMRRYFMHGTSHYVGLDVHDPQVVRTLAPNQVLTVEPGVYIAPGSPCDPRWWGIGVRIEDDILVTDGDPVNLSGALPREIPEIEALMAQDGLGNLPAGRLPK